MYIILNSCRKLGRIFLLLLEMECHRLGFLGWYMHSLIFMKKNGFGA